MQTVVVGAGPAGLVTGMALARGGEQVTVVDRDPGPAGPGTWARRGVMQFHQPHVFRAMTRLLLAERLPDVLEAVVDAGAVPFRSAGAPEETTLLRCRRETFERALRLSAMAEPGLDLVQGRAGGLVLDHDQVTGVVVDGRRLSADLVVDATGRHGRLAEGLRAGPEGGDCGFAYASRLYRLRPGAEPGPQNAAPGLMQMAKGFLLLLFVHDAGTFTVLLVRDARDRELADLRHEPVWDAAMAGLDVTRAWTDPERAVPLGRVRAGAGLTNHYQGQVSGVQGLLAVGDSVSTTNPAGGRGVSLAVAQAFALADVVDGYDEADRAAALDEWCGREIRPWYEDAVALDAATHRMWDGVPVDPEGPITADLVMAAAEVDPRLGAVLGPYFTMQATPTTLTAAHPRVRELLRQGWRPGPPPGPDRDDLAAATREAARAVARGEVPRQRGPAAGAHQSQTSSTHVV